MICTVRLKGSTGQEMIFAISASQLEGWNEEAFILERRE